MFNCRDLDGGLRVLIKDYSIRCSTSQHHAFELIAGAYVVFVSLGIPFCVGFAFQVPLARNHTIMLVVHPLGNDCTLFCR
jgi:hypothetical protein